MTTVNCLPLLPKIEHQERHDLVDGFQYENVNHGDTYDRGSEK